MKKLLSVSLIGVLTLNSPSFADSFGTGTLQFAIDFVTINNTHSAADTTGAPNPVGGVNYAYRIAKYEISRGMVNKVNSNNSTLGITMTDMSPYHNGNGANRPANGISWFEAAKFVNWLNTSTGAAAAYKFDQDGAFQLWTSEESGYDASNLYRNRNANYWLPSIDEWYKAAYGSPSGTWYDYPNGSDTVPEVTPGGTSGAVYNQIFAGPIPETGPADIDQAGSLSAWGTMGQGGNVNEWTETAGDGTNDDPSENRKVRGGHWAAFPFYMASYYDMDAEADRENLFTSGDAYVGFRVASAVGIPEPSGISLLTLGLIGLASWHRRRN